MGHPSLSVVIPTYRREERLCETVRALLDLAYPDWELLIVDQTPEHTEETMAFLATLPPRVRRVVSPIPSLPGARNIGAREARGDVVLYLDDDILPTSELPTAHARHYTDPTVGGVAGRLISPGGEIRPLDPRYHSSSLPWLYIRFDQDWSLREVESAPGGNLSIRRRLIHELGGFDERYVGNAFREETDFCLRLRAAGHRILFDPAAAVVHYFGTPGGCDNVNFGGRSPESHSYYRTFFHNNAYFALKNFAWANRVRILFRVYRDHGLNRPLLTQGPRFILRRHLAIFLGLWDGWRTWRNHRPPQTV